MQHLVGEPLATRGGIQKRIRSAGATGSTELRAQCRPGTEFDLAAWADFIHFGR